MRSFVVAQTSSHFRTLVPVTGTRAIIPAFCQATPLGVIKLNTAMLTLDEARSIVSEIIASQGGLYDERHPNYGDTLIILDHLTVYKPYAWIFTYTSRLWFETQDMKYAIAGNAPIIIDKVTGKPTSYSTAYGIETITEKYEEENGLYSLILINYDTLDKHQILVLKNLLELSYEKLAQLKSAIPRILDRGSELRLTNLKAQLAEKGFETRVELTESVNNYA